MTGCQIAWVSVGCAILLVQPGHQAIMRSLWATISPVVNESAATDDSTRF